MCVKSKCNQSGSRWYPGAKSTPKFKLQRSIDPDGKARLEIKLTWNEYDIEILKSVIENLIVYPKGIGENEPFGNDLSFKHVFSCIGHAHTPIISCPGFLLHLINFNNDLV